MGREAVRALLARLEPAPQGGVAETSRVLLLPSGDLVVRGFAADPKAGTDVL